MDTKKKVTPGRFLDRKQSAQYIGLSDFWLEKHCNDPDGPRWFRHGRKCWYRKTDLDAWLRTRREERGGMDAIWRTSESRQIPEPAEKELETAYVEEWGKDEATTRETAADVLKSFLASLTHKQLAMLAKAKDAEDAHA